MISEGVGEVIRTKIEVPDTLCYDFICSVLRLHNNAVITPQNNPDTGIVEWASKYLAVVPTAMRQTAEAFFNLETTFGITLMGLIKQSQVATISKFLSYLEEVSGEELLARFLYTGVGPGTDITPDYITSLKNDQALAFNFVQEELSYSPQEKWRVMGYLLSPEQTKAQLIDLLQWHYRQVYRQDEEEIAAFLSGANKQLSARLSYDKEFLDLLVPYDKQRPPKNLTIALSYYIEDRRVFDVMNSLYVFGYKCYHEAESKHSVYAGVQVFKALADETRLQILRLLVERPWYGHEIAQRLHLSNSTVSHHISILTLSALVSAYRQENRVYYELNTHEVRGIVIDALERVLRG